MTKDNICHCSHERAYHDPCSVCKCPAFRSADKVKAKKYSLWKKAD